MIMIPADQQFGPADHGTSMTLIWSYFRIKMNFVTPTFVHGEIRTMPEIVTTQWFAYTIV